MTHEEAKKWVDADELKRCIGQEIQKLATVGLFADMMLKEAEIAARACVELIDKQPTVEVEPVKHGHWISKPVMIRQPYAFNHTCSVCGRETNCCSPYCGNCGSRMDEVCG